MATVVVGCGDKVVDTSTLGGDALACHYPEAQEDGLARECAGRNTEFDQVLLVLLSSKAQVAALGDRLPLPCDARHRATQVHAGAGGVHLTEVDDDSIDLHKELVSWGPVVNLVESKLNGDPVCQHGSRTEAARHTERLGHGLASTAKPSQELREAWRVGS